LGKKYEKSEKKRRKKEEKRRKMEKNLINKTIFSLTCVGVTNLIMSVGEYKKEEMKIQ
jgi:hypothetical protein